MNVSDIFKSLSGTHASENLRKKFQQDVSFASGFMINRIVCQLIQKVCFFIRWQNQVQVYKTKFPIPLFSALTYGTI